MLAAYKTLLRQKTEDQAFYSLDEHQGSRNTCHIRKLNFEVIIFEIAGMWPIEVNILV